VAFARLEVEAAKGGLELLYVGVEGLGFSHQGGAHDAASAKEADGIVHDELSIVLRQPRPPFQPSSLAVIVTLPRPAVEQKDRELQAAALVDFLFSLLVQDTQQCGRVEALVILDVAALVEVEDREPSGFRPQRVFVVPRRIAIELEKAAGAVRAEKAE